LGKRKKEGKKREKGEKELMKEQKTKRNSFSLFSSLSLSLTVRGPRGLGLVKLLVEGPVRAQALGRAVVGGAAVAAAAAQADDALREGVLERERKKKRTRF
jgi:hypothetical protein